MELFMSKRHFVIRRDRFLLILAMAVVGWGGIHSRANIGMYDASFFFALFENSTTRPTNDQLKAKDYDPFAVKNIHRNFPLVCGVQNINSSVVHPATHALFHMANSPPRSYGYWSGHRAYKGNLSQAVELLTRLQSCLYTVLDSWWMLAEEHNVTRWSAHGGTAMGAYCHRSMNPWDDDIDITVGSCEPLERMWANSRNVSEVYPDVPTSQYNDKVFQGRLVNKDWILMRGPRKEIRRYCHSSYFKLKSVVEARAIQGRNLGGMDIMCMDDFITPDEEESMRESGFEDYLKGDEPLQTVQFGPTYMKLIPDEVLKDYVFHRYEKQSFCDFPYDKSSWRDSPSQPMSHTRSSQIEFAVSKWYTSEEQRSDWLQLVGNISGKELTKEVPNLNEVELDNTIANTMACHLGAQNHMMKVIGFNAERGTYWSEFADMVRTIKDLEEPDIIILNEMDNGMARSRNVHTTRKLAFELGMNYAWGLEFIELTRGNREEQNATTGMQNSLGLYGNAILSKCKLYDPLIVRDDLDDIYFSNKVSWENADGHEKRLGGRMGLFAKIETRTTVSREVVVGSVHKLGPTHRDLWKYFGFGEPPVDFDTRRRQPYNETDFDKIPRNRSHVIVAGDLTQREFCGLYGLSNLDLQRDDIQKTFRADCSLGSPWDKGKRRGDYFCGNIAVAEEDKSFAPCHTHNGTTRQIADHSIIEIVLQTPE